MTIEQLLESARRGLRRVGAQEADRAMREGAVLIDIRAESQRERDGVVPGSVFVARNVLEWRCTPGSEARDPRLSEPGLRLILMCNEGYASSVAAATLQQLGMAHATDLIGGFRAWREAGLAVVPSAGAGHGSESAG